MRFATIDTSRRPIIGRPISFELAFAIAFGGAILAAVVASALPSPVDRYAMPTAAAAVLAGMFVWKPAPALLAFALFVLGYDTLGHYIGEGVKRADEIAVVAIGLIALVRDRPWRTWRPSLLREGGMALFVIAGLAGSLLNGVPITIWAPALALVMKPIVIFYAALWLRVDRTILLSAARVTLAFGLVVAVLGLVEAIDPGAFQQAIGLPEWVRPRSGLPSIKSIFRHPAIFAWFMSFLALYCFIGFVHLRNRWLLVLGFVFGVATFMTARRRAIIAALSTLALAFGWTVRRPARLVPELRRWAPVFAATALLVVAFIPGLVGLYDRTVDRYLPGETPAPGELPEDQAADDEDRATGPARYALYRGAVEIALDNAPFGAGMGRYGSWMSRVEYSPLYTEYGLNRVPGLRQDNSQYATDTFWPMVLGEAGIVGLVGYGAFLLGIGLPLWALGRRTTEPLSTVFVVGALAALTAGVIESAATPMFTSPPRSYLFFVALGATLGAASYLAPRLSGDGPASDPAVDESEAR
jgi:hypothetical protein